ncbi:hypothetical protein HWV62_26694 [Athelia sp. TMB]|nr:hypothetical protein HWV62_4511 [Athelia sp. TMB]KAF7982778.1 hypothetical protein HWV62_26694 [Athelia sp. TMB]
MYQSREWAWAAGESQMDHEIRWNSMNVQQHESGSKMIYHKLHFKDFTGIALGGIHSTDIFPPRSKPLSTAIRNAYTISPADGKGSGMFASQDIPAAGLILVENPVIVCPITHSGDLDISKDESFRLLFDGLHPDVRAKVLSLHNSNPFCPYAEGIVRTNAFGLPLTPIDSVGSPGAVGPTALIYGINPPARAV